MSPVPLIRQPFGLPPSPEGKAKDQPSIKRTSAAERRKRDYGSHRRSRAYTPINGHQTPYVRRESASRSAPKTFLWGSGAAFLFLGKRNVPQIYARPDVQPQKTGRRPSPVSVLFYI